MILHYYRLYKISYTHRNKCSDYTYKLTHKPFKALPRLVLLIIKHIGIHSTIGYKRKCREKPPKPYKNKQHPYLLYKNIHTGKAENRTNNIHNEQIAFTDFSYQKRRQKHSRCCSCSDNCCKSAV